MTLRDRAPLPYRPEHPTTVVSLPAALERAPYHAQ
jgi:hypothetical protein